MPHTRFMFIHRGARFSAEAFKEELGLCWAEGCRDAMHNHLTFFRTAARTRVCKVEAVIGAYNARRSQAMRIMLIAPSEGEPAIATAPRRSLSRCAIYNEIAWARVQGSATYWSWFERIEPVRDQCVIEAWRPDAAVHFDEQFEELGAFIHFFDNGVDGM